MVQFLLVLRTRHCRVPRELIDVRPAQCGIVVKASYAVDISIIIPAYNEAIRLPPYLKEVVDYFVQQGEAFEVLIVDDGSTDNTCEIVLHDPMRRSYVRLLRHDRNHGRGKALLTGIQSARGRLILYADADGATPIAEEAKLRAAIEQGADIAIGSRAWNKGKAKAARSMGRKTLSSLYYAVLRPFIALPVLDAMCGFKMWRSAVGCGALSKCQERHWMLDVEFLAIAAALGYRISEVPVEWFERSGSKVRLIRDAFQVVLGIWRIRRSVASVIKSSGPLGRNTCS